MIDALRAAHAAQAAKVPAATATAAEEPAACTPKLVNVLAESTFMQAGCISSERIREVVTLRVTLIRGCPLAGNSSKPGPAAAARGSTCEDPGPHEGGPSTEDAHRPLGA